MEIIYARMEAYPAYTDIMYLPLHCHNLRPYHHAASIRERKISQSTMFLVVVRYGHTWRSCYWDNNTHKLAYTGTIE